MTHLQKCESEKKKALLSECQLYSGVHLCPLIGLNTELKMAALLKTHHRHLLRQHWTSSGTHLSPEKRVWEEEGGKLFQFFTYCHLSSFLPNAICDRHQGSTRTGRFREIRPSLHEPTQLLDATNQGRGWQASPWEKVHHRELSNTF